MPIQARSRPLSSPAGGTLRHVTLLAVTCLVSFGLFSSNALAAQLPVDLGTAGSFAALAGTTVTNAGFSKLNGDLGVSPGSALTGFPPGIVNGTTHAADPVAARAQADLTTAYNDAAGRTPPNALPTDVGGRTLTPGVYKADPALGLTGTLTLDGQGDSNAVFVFQVGSALTTAVGSRVNLINGAQPSNIFWQIGSSATLGTSSVFAGTILALSSISMNDGVTLNGRALARNGAVTLINDTITAAPGPAADLVDHVTLPSSPLKISIDPASGELVLTGLPGRQITRDSTTGKVLSTVTLSRTRVSFVARDMRRLDPAWAHDPVAGKGTPPTAPRARHRLRRATARSADGTYECVVNHKPSRKYKNRYRIYKPVYASRANKAIYEQYSYNLYKRSRARFLGRQNQKQFEMCTTGGAHSRGGNRLTRSVSSFAPRLKAPIIRGKNWGDHASEAGLVQATLGFTGGKGPISINGSVQTHRQNTFGGSQGTDKDTDLGGNNRFVFNQVNTYWEAADDPTIFAGSTHYQGNVGHGLYELPQSGRDPTFAEGIGSTRICGRAARAGCE